jgi:hypothetical protein
MKLANKVLDNKKEIYTPTNSKLGIELKGGELYLNDKHLILRVMRKRIMASEALLEIIIIYLSSP